MKKKTQGRASALKAKLNGFYFPPFSIEGEGYEKPPLKFAEREAELWSPTENSKNAPYRKERSDFWKKITTASLDAFRSVPQVSDWVKVLLSHAERGDNLSTAALALIAREILDGLHALTAAGNKYAASQWMGTLGKSSDEFESVMRNCPSAVQDLVRQSFAVPGMISRVSEKERSNAQLLQQMKQGDDWSFDLVTARKSPSLFGSQSTDANHLALRLVAYIENARTDPRGEDPLPWFVQSARKLKPFSRRALSEWKELAWEIVMNATREKPEENPLLSPIGRYAVQKGGRHGEKDAGRRAKWIRNGIKTRLDQSLKLLSDRATATKDSR